MTRAPSWELSSYQPTLRVTSCPYSEGTKVLQQLISVGHTKENRADTFTTKTPRWETHTKRQVVVFYHREKQIFVLQHKQPHKQKTRSLKETHIMSPSTTCTYSELSSSALQPVGQQMELFDFTELLLPLITVETLFKPCITLNTHTNESQQRNVLYRGGIRALCVYVRVCVCMCVPSWQPWSSLGFPRCIFLLACHRLMVTRSWLQPLRKTGVVDNYRVF